MAAKKCPRCGAPLKGYVDECPSCGMEKPLPLSWKIYLVMVLILAATVWFLVDWKSAAEAIRASRGL